MSSKLEVRVGRHRIVEVVPRKEPVEKHADGKYYYIIILQFLCGLSQPVAINLDFDRQGLSDAEALDLINKQGAYKLLDKIPYQKGQEVEILSNGRIYLVSSSGKGGKQK